jgi:hypothetical protein
MQVSIMWVVKEIDVATDVSDQLQLAAELNATA